MNLVDLGKHLDWENNSNLSSSVVRSSANIWNSYKPGVVREDNLLRIKDVEIISGSTLSSLGRTYPSGLIELNNSLISGPESTQISILAHEIGHALNLGHINDSTQLMNHTHTQDILSLKGFDKSSYDKAYSLY